MLPSTVFAVLALCNSAMASWPGARHAAHPAPAGVFKQTTREEIVSRRKRRANRPARRALVSPTPPPPTVNGYNLYGGYRGYTYIYQPDEQFTIPATFTQTEVIEQCIGGATNPPYDTAAVSYSNSEDIWYCSYWVNYGSIFVTPDANTAYIAMYQ